MRAVWAVGLAVGWQVLKRRTPRIEDGAPPAPTYAGAPGGGPKG